MKITNYLTVGLLFGILVMLIIISRQNVTNKTKTPNCSIVVNETNDPSDYYKQQALEMVPLEDDEIPEITTYRNNLAQWLEWNDECMGMDPKTKPKDPRIKK